MQTKTLRYSGWGRAKWATAGVHRPERRKALEALMAEAPAPAIGSLRSYGDAPLNDGGRAIDMTRMNRLTAFDPETGHLTVEAGATLGEIAALMIPRGWILPVMPGTGAVTVGGAIANDVHGKNHHIAGSFGQHVRSITIATPVGRKTATPGRLKDLFAATMGGLGQTGIILEAEIALAPAKGEIMRVTERRVGGWDEQIALLDGSEASYAVAWIDAVATGAELGRGILEEAETGEGRADPPGRTLSLPLDAPGLALSPPVVRAFNAAYLRRVPEAGRTAERPFRQFFFPLDRIARWNRLYGKSGFHQFQCVVPLSGVEMLRSMLDRIASSGHASPLAVLKRMGPGRAGPMSFPMEGYTLAVDLHGRSDPADLVSELEAMVLDAEGRIYLAKDALAAPEAVAAMYPERADWAATVAKYDPDGAMVTDLVRRLALREAP